MKPFYILKFLKNPVLPFTYTSLLGSLFTVLLCPRNFNCFFKRNGQTDLMGSSQISFMTSFNIFFFIIFFFLPFSFSFFLFLSFLFLFYIPFSFSFSLFPIFLSLLFICSLLPFYFITLFFLLYSFILSFSYLFLSSNFLLYSYSEGNLSCLLEVDHKING